MKHRLEKKLKSKGVAKVPVIMQMESAECGAASLAMIMAYFGKWVSLEEVRTRCDVSADGAKPSNIVRAGQGLGLDGHAYRYELGALKTKGKFPCIAFVEFSHFIVLKGIRGNRIYINDPGRGNYSMTMDSFDKIFTGLILSFEPNENFVADGQRMSVISFIKDNVKGSYAAMVMLSIATALISVIGLIRPEIDREFIDNVLVRDDFEWEMIFLLILLSISFCNVIMEIVRSVVSYRLSGKLDIVGESSLLWSVLNKPLRFFSQRMIGDIQQRQESNSEISGTIVNTFVPMLINSCMAVFYLVVILNYNVVLGCIGLFATIAKLVIARIISKIKINITRQRLRNHGKLVGITVTGIDMIETIKSSGAESGFLNRWTGYHSLVNESNIKYSTINVYLGTIPTIITIVSNIVILALGCGLIMDGHLTLGAFMAINSLIASFADPAGMLITSGQTIQEMRTQMERIKDVFDYPEDEIFKDETEASDLPIKKLEGDIELKNVSFGYTKLGPKTIEDINISVKKGQQIAIVGGSGCGKSTVAKIMTGLLRPDEGEVFFDGRKLNEITHREFVASVASVDQECFLFDDTIENNIRIWNQEIENSDIVKAAKDAQIHEEIIRNFGNYSYKIKESGKNISGGQKQRIEIARVLASNPSIILLDEATNALDSKTEYEVMKAIKQREATCIIIAHRLSTIRDCDTIYVMDKGKIVEQGTHDKLYEANGIYKALITNE